MVRFKNAKLSRTSRAKVYSTHRTYEIFRFSRAYKTYGVFGTLAFSLLIGSLITLPTVLVKDSASATTPLNPDATLSIVPAGDIRLNMQPIAGSSGSFNTVNANVTINTDNITGYTFTMSTTTSNADLVNKEIDYTNSDNTDLKIANLTTSTTESNFTSNKWGYNVTKTNNTTNNNNSNNNSNNNNNNNNDSNTTTYLKGATNTYLPVPNSTSSDNDKQIEVTTTAGNNTYNFTYGVKANNDLPAGDYENTLIFSATANEGPLAYMQDFDYATCKTLTTDETITLRDARDNTDYTVAKLKDGNCWMTQNLELGQYGQTTNLTSEDSNVPTAGYSLTFDYANNSVYKGNSNKYGNYYNFLQATAGSGDNVVAEGEDAPYSICPKNWRLPSAGTAVDIDNEFYSLMINYIKTGTWSDYRWMDVTITDFIDAPVSLVLSGDINGSGEQGGQDMGGDWWSSTSIDWNAARDLFVYRDGRVNPRASDARFYGFSVRCLSPGSSN